MATHIARWLAVFFAALMFSCCPTVQSQERVDNDIATINNTEFCTTDVVTGLTVNPLQTPGSVRVSWTRPSSLKPNVTGYQVVYHPISTTTVQVESFSLSTTEAILTNLQDSSTYEFHIRLVCTPTLGVGPLSGVVNLTLVDTLPEGVVGDVSITTGNNVVTVTWSPLPESQWNGIPRGYFIYLYRRVDDSLPFTYHRVAYPRTNYSIGLTRGTYYIGIVAVNDKGFSKNESGRIEVVVESGAASGGGNPQDIQVLDYPWVYILIPGVICVVIIVVITLVLFKKVHESKKRTVTYCRDIEEQKYNGSHGYNNIIPMNNLSSPVTSTSLSIPNSSPGATSTVPQTNFLANRPLPNSPPLSDMSPTFVEQDIPQFGNGLPSNARPERKMPHPGGLPSLGEVREPDFVQLQRTNTSQSVFAPPGASVVPAPTHHGGQRQRNRAQTVGGIPSPYEVPEQNGNTLPRGDRPSTAHATHHGNVFNVGGSSSIPPPPAHSPPPLTHSSMEIRARMGDDVFSPTGQHTLPRSMGSSRSYSVTSTGSGGRGGGAGGGANMRHMKSDGHLPHLPLLETHEEKMVYIQPPLDSSAEASIHSAGSYGHGREEVGGDRRVSPHHQQQHQHRRFQGQPPLRQPNPNTATYVAESESFSEMTSEAGSIVSGPAPRMPVHHHTHAHAPMYNRERSNQSHGRESVFSETSTELSVSSTSEKEMSPTGWDHRGTTSEVGVGFRHHGDTSPVDREAYSDVGTPGQLPAHSQRVYKQV